MSRADRRRFERQFEKVLKTSGDNCSICGRVLEHNDRTFGGFDTSDTVVLTGDCCSRKIKKVMAQGVFATRNAELLAANTSKPQPRQSKPHDIDEAVSTLRDHFTHLDDMGRTIMRQGGVIAAEPNLNFLDSPWKSDDAQWFRLHPKRAHRLRPAFANELDSLPSQLKTISLPERHEIQILVRQVEVGKRIRAPFARNLAVPLPDLEELLHALFDLNSSGGSQGVISAQEVGELAAKYGSAAKS